MSGALEAVNRAAGAWADLAWAVTWQSAILVAGFALVALGMRRSSPGLRYGLWQIAAIKLLLMPMWGVAIALPAGLARDPVGRPGMPPVGRAEGPIDGGPDGRIGGLGPEAMADGPTGEAAGEPPGFARIGPPGWR